MNKKAKKKKELKEKKEKNQTKHFDTTLTTNKYMKTICYYEKIK